MATVGYTALEAVNEVLAAMGLAPIGSAELTSSSEGDGSDEGEAQRILALVSRDEQMAAADSHYVFESFTPSGGQVDLGNGGGAAYLRVRGAGKLTNRRVTIRDGFLYDLDDNSDDQWGVSAITLEVVPLIAWGTDGATWETLSPDLKTLIVKKARRKAITDRRAADPVYRAQVVAAEAAEAQQSLASARAPMRGAHETPSSTADATIAGMGRGDGER